MRLLTLPSRRDDGSLPIALLVSIMVAGIIAVLTARIVAGEGQVRFDRSFTESFHTADAGVQQAVFQLNAGVHEDMENGTTTSPETVEFGDETYTWTLTRNGPRSWTVESTGHQGEVARTVEANITEQPLFFPGAFGDTLIALNGTSTNVDSYNSEECDAEDDPADCEWGTDDTFGTGNGSMATNGEFDWGGTEEGLVRPGGAFLYDWLANPGDGITNDEPFGDRCDGNPCTEEYVSTVDEELDFSSSDEMQFITDAVDDCDGEGQELDDATFGSRQGNSDPVAPLEPYEADPDWDVAEVTDPDFVNYYCADSLEFGDDTPLDDSATVENPVVIFVRDYVTVDGQVKVGCVDCDGASGSGSLPDQDELPKSARLQIYVAGEERDGGKKGANVTYGAGSVYAGIMYGPRSRCGSPGGAGVDIFGSIICGSMDNVGNWHFHYDDYLGTYGTGSFGVGYYTEEPGSDS